MGRRDKKRVTADAPVSPKKPFSIPLSALNTGHDARVAAFESYKPPEGVIPAGQRDSALAMDSTPYETLNSYSMGFQYGGFRGYPYLAMLSQAPEYANVHAVFADEITRTGIKITSSADEPALVEHMEDLLIKYGVKDIVHHAVFHDSLFGVAHIYIDTGADDHEKQNPLFKDPRKVNGKLKGFRLVEPVWMYPAMYNANDPLADNYYRPDAWFVMGKTVHASRFIDLVSRPVSQILKPSYNFGGLSLTQLMEPYVNAWEQIRQEIPKIINAFTLSGLKTDMDARMRNPAEFKRRIDLMAEYRNNRGVLALDKEEEFFQVNTPMTDLEKLAANYQEQLCIPSRMPVIKLLGNLPPGLGSSGQGEIDVWHETVAGIQERDVRPLLKAMLDYIMLAELGGIREEIDFEFNPLEEMSDIDLADVRLKNAQALSTLQTAGTIDTADGHQWLMNDPHSGFGFLKDTEYEQEEEYEEDA